MDAITLLKDDHKAAEKILARYEKAGDRACSQNCTSFHSESSVFCR